MITLVSYIDDYTLFFFGRGGGLLSGRIHHLSLGRPPPRPGCAWGLIETYNIFKVLKLQLTTFGISF